LTAFLLCGECANGISSPWFVRAFERGLDALERAKELRAKLDTLPEGSPQRAELEQHIRDLLRSANSISEVVKSSIPKS